MREALRPLISLWIDTLVLRLLNEPMPDQKPVWFVIDELASLQRLPQLHTAITENRKSQNPVILGFQGRSQMEARYGQDAEAMLSQPATKIFLRTTEPRAAKWVAGCTVRPCRYSFRRGLWEAQPGATPGDRRTTRSTASVLRIPRCRRKDRKDNGAQGRMGCYLFRSKVCFVDGSCRRR